MKNVLQLLKLIRFQNLAIIAFTQLLTARFLIEGNSFISLVTDSKLIFLILSTVLIASGGYLINDYYDIKIDYVNKPERVVIGKHIKRRQVLVLHTFYNLAGILLGVLVSWWLVAINVLATFLLWLYSNLLKRLPLWGNLTVSFLTGLSVFVVYIPYKTNYDFIIMYTIFAFFISLVREIVKDLEDIEGDEKFGCKTLPIAIGPTATKQIIYLINTLFLTIVFTLTHSLDYFWPFFVTLTLILVLFSSRVYLADKKSDYSKISLFAKLIMVLGIASMTLI